MKDFYIVFHPVGYQFIKTMETSFKYIPKEYNVVVMTPTPELLKDVKTDFNLIVLNSLDLMDDFAKNASWKTAYITDADHEVYVEKLLSEVSKGNIFPDHNHRFILPWLAKNNITKFILCNTDCLINFRGEFENGVDRMIEKFGDRNVIFGPLMQHHTDINRMYESYGDVFEKRGYDKETMKSVPNPYTLLDGWARGFWFQDTEMLMEFFYMWDDMIKHCYEIQSHDLLQGFWTMTDEWLFGLVAQMMKIRYGLSIEDMCINGLYVIAHAYHPENSYFRCRFALGEERFKNANTRKEFIESNRDLLVRFYERFNGLPQDRVHELIYDFNEK
jgi:hypothetical protein